jgi:hypothetical protein
MGKQLTLLLTWCDQLLVHVPVEDRSCYLGQGRISVRYGGALRRNPPHAPSRLFFSAASPWASSAHGQWAMIHKSRRG